MSGGMSGGTGGDWRVTAAARSDAAIATELERRQRRLAHADAAPVATTAMLCWRLGGTNFATRLDAVRTVLDMVAATGLPGAPPAVIGLFSRRGVVHTLFDPAALLSVTADGGRGAVLIVRAERPCVAIRVDAVDAVSAMPTAMVAAVPQAGRVARAVAMPDGSPVTIVDMDRLIGHLTGRTAAPDGPMPEEG